MNVKERLAADSALIDAKLKELTAENDLDFSAELEAERYSLLAPRAKRIRPALVLEFCRLFGGEEKAALPFAAAVEMVHTYSLIHDDLPAMDNDDLRRGRPTCHKAFGESTAVLAGDGLLTRAFGVLATNEYVSAQTVKNAVIALSNAAGPFGMVGGQVMDLQGEKTKWNLEKLRKLQANKTGKMIAVSAQLGCYAAGLTENEERTQAALRYADGIGLAFQIVDDVLDATADEQIAGKSVGSDAENGKTTFLTYYTVKEALDLVKDLTAKAKNEIVGFAGSEFLLQLADYLTERNF